MWLIDWFNTNQGFLSTILSILTFIFSIIAILIAVQSTRKQNKIALYENRYRVFLKIQKLVFAIGDKICSFQSKDYNGLTISNELRYSKLEVCFLFDKDVQKKLLQIIDDALTLNDWGIDALKENISDLNKLIEQIYSKELLKFLNKYIGLGSL